MSTVHYAQEGTVYFYGGPFSNFQSGPFSIPIDPAHRLPWHPSGPVMALTTEHYYQAMKADNLRDFQAVLDRGTAREAKQRGRRSHLKLRPDWEEIKYDVMVVALRIKFQRADFGSVLMATGDRKIAEDSPTDPIWGIRDPAGGFTGRNLLGKALMQVRSELRAAVPTP